MTGARRLFVRFDGVCVAFLGLAAPRSVYWSVSASKVCYRELYVVWFLVVGPGSLVYIGRCSCIENSRELWYIINTSQRPMKVFKDLHGNIKPSHKWHFPGSDSTSGLYLMFSNFTSQITVHSKWSDRKRWRVDVSERASKNYNLKKSL